MKACAHFCLCRKARNNFALFVCGLCMMKMREDLEMVDTFLNEIRLDLPFDMNVVSCGRKQQIFSLCHTAIITA